MTPASRILTARMPSELQAEAELSRQQRCPRAARLCGPSLGPAQGPKGGLRSPSQGGGRKERRRGFPSLSFLPCAPPSRVQLMRSAVVHL